MFELKSNICRPSNALSTYEQNIQQARGITQTRYIDLWEILLDFRPSSRGGSYGRSHKTKTTFRFSQDFQFMFYEHVLVYLIAGSNFRGS